MQPLFFREKPGSGSNVCRVFFLFFCYYYYYYHFYFVLVATGQGRQFARFCFHFFFIELGGRFSDGCLVFSPLGCTFLDTGSRFAFFFP